MTALHRLRFEGGWWADRTASQPLAHCVHVVFAGTALMHCQERKADTSVGHLRPHVADEPKCSACLAGVQ